MKPDLLRTDDNWENWDMAALIDEVEVAESGSG